jgi:hypothetical protein
LVQDSTFFPEVAAQRVNYFRRKKTNGNSNHHDDDDDGEELSSYQNLQQQQQQQVTDRKATPLFVDYCRRKSLEDQSSSTTTTTTTTSSTIIGGESDGGNSPISVCSVVGTTPRLLLGRSGTSDTSSNNATVVVVASSSLKDNAAKELPFARSCNIVDNGRNNCGGGRQKQDDDDLMLLSRRPSFQGRVVLSQHHSSLEEQNAATTTTTTTATATTACNEIAQSTITTSSSTPPAAAASTKKIPKHIVYSIQECELEFGKILGSGGFGQVRLARIRNNNFFHRHYDSTIPSSSSFTTSFTTSATTITTTTADTTNANGTIDTATTTTKSFKEEEETTTNNNNTTTKKHHHQYYAMKYLLPTKTSHPPSPPTSLNNNTNNNNTNNTEQQQQQQQQQIIKPSISKFERAIADLVIEARFLSLLSHENIIKLWFVSEGSLEENFNCGGGGESNCCGSGSNGRRRRSTGSSGSSSSSVEGGGSGRRITMRRRSLKHNNSNSNNGNGRGGGGYHHPYYRQHGYFLLLDALHETLHQRIQNLYIPEVIDTPLRIYESNKTYVSNEGVAKRQLASRLLSLRSIASALQYMHEDCNLIYRDIKPGNIGFYRRYNDGGFSCVCGHAENNDRSSSSCTCNYTDIPKLFDFGLAKELKSKYRKVHPAHRQDDPPTFKLTGATGSRRYMSPEVASREPYNHKADVYSFGMVLYQISALVVPFDGLAVKNHEKEVIHEGVRPDVTIPSKTSSVRRTRDFRRHYMKESDRERKNLMLSKRARCVWPEGLNALISECWDDDMRKRPEMREVVERLDGCIEELNHSAKTS